jgi:hypothetical protein
MARRAINAPAPELSDDDLVEFIARFRYDPHGFVMAVFPWGEEGTDLHAESGPDDWQRELLIELGKQVRERRDNPLLPAIQIAVASGHGVGKTAFLSWVIIWFMSCHMDISVVVTANTLGQLSGKTWRELARWHRRALHADWFQWTATTFYLKERSETHKANATPWTKEKSEAFAGTHAKWVLMVYDEGSAIDDSIWEVSEGAMTTSGAIWLVFGNPTKNTGRFRECWRRYRHRWTTRKIDSRTAKKANKGQIEAWIQDHGEDSDFVRIRVRGEFPRVSAAQLIGTDIVEQAQNEWKRRVNVELVARALAHGPSAVATLKLDLSNTAPRILSCDVARFGPDQTVFGWRVGRAFLPLVKLRGLDTVQVAHRLVEWIKGLEPDAINVDGSGLGAGVVDTLRSMNYDVNEVNSAVKAIDERKFTNRRAEMWWAMRDWLAAGGTIPDNDGDLMTDLTAPEYTYAGRDRIQLEGKDDMRARGLSSPDTADALALTFAVPVAPRMHRGGQTVAAAFAAFAARHRGGGGAPSWRSR